MYKIIHLAGNCCASSGARYSPEGNIKNSCASFETQGKLSDRNAFKCEEGNWYDIVFFIMPIEGCKGCCETGLY